MLQDCTIDPREVAHEELLARDGLKIRACTGVAVNPLTRNFRLQRSTRVNYMLMSTRTERKG